MGYTRNTTKLVRAVIANYHVAHVVDLGSQQNYDQPNLPAPYISEWYKENFNISASNPDRRYYSIDINGENDSAILNLAEDWFMPHATDLHDIHPRLADEGADLLVDAGTSEHVGWEQQFSWAAIYNCWRNKHNLLKIDGIMINENPKTGNWPGHGFNYYTKEFYRALEAVTDYHIILLDEHPAMENRVDGWNIVCVMQKKSDRFPSLDQFKELGIKFQ